MAKTPEEKNAILDKYFKAVSDLSHLRVGDPGYDTAVERYNRYADAYVAAVTGSHPKEVRGRVKYQPKTRVRPRMKVASKTENKSKPEPQPGVDD